MQLIELRQWPQFLREFRRAFRLSGELDARRKSDATFYQKLTFGNGEIRTKRIEFKSEINRLGPITALPTIGHAHSRERRFCP